MGDYPDIPFVQAAGDGGPRSLTQMVVIHATDNTASDEAEASYASHRPDQISAHFYNDEDSVIQGVLLSHVAWGCYPTGNSRSVQFELCGLSNRLTDATLRRIAPIVRRVCDRYGIPIRHIGPADLRAGTKGICGHGDVTAAWGEGSHTDPGAGFPWDTFIGYITPTSGDDMPLFLRIKETGACWVSDGPTRAGIASMDDLTELLAAYPGAALRHIPQARIGAYGVDVGAPAKFTLSAEQLAQLDIGPAELAAIKQASAEGAASAVPAITDAIVARLPANAMTRADVEQAVRDAFAGGLAPDVTPTAGP